MNPIFFVNGFVVGFSIAAPIGPIGLLCIQRTFVEGGYRDLLLVSAPQPQTRYTHP